MQPLASSYRDPAGFVFRHKDKVYRFIAPAYFAHYDFFKSNGLYESLTQTGRLVSHEEINDDEINALFSQKGRIILPQQLPFISYPYEWSFDMWRDAALVTLKIALAALEKGMMIKDATAFNIQFFIGRPVFIDTLSFEKYNNGEPWVAYRQFCECFLGPLLLMHYGHRDAGKLFMAYPEGIPLEMISAMLPAKAKWNIHVNMHIRMQLKISQKQESGKEKGFSKKKLQLLLNGLIGFIEKLEPRKTASEWNDYYSDTILGKDYLDAKTAIIKKFTEGKKYQTILDLGANDGFFSLLLKDHAQFIVATDADSSCINSLYKALRKEKIKNILPLVNTLNAPAPAIGFRNAERESFTERAKADLVLALALIHHLAISANLPLENIAAWLKETGEELIIEFVPPSDEKVKLLLQNRKNGMPNYTLEKFREAFAAQFDFIKEEKVGNTDRILFYLQRKK